MLQDMAGYEALVVTFMIIIANWGRAAALFHLYTSVIDVVLDTRHVCYMSWVLVLFLYIQKLSAVHWLKTAEFKLILCAYKCLDVAMLSLPYVDCGALRIGPTPFPDRRS